MDVGGAPGVLSLMYMNMVCHTPAVTLASYHQSSPFTHSSSVGLIYMYDISLPAGTAMLMSCRRRVHTTTCNECMRAAATGNETVCTVWMCGQSLL